MVLEEALLDKVRYLHEKTASENLCMAGGVALNCVANAHILKEGPFRRLFVQPAAGDAGTCLGAAALAQIALTGSPPKTGRLEEVFLGPQFSSDQVGSLIHNTGMTAQDFRGREFELLSATVDRLIAGEVIGWFHGRMEFGPRALGARSLLADPRDPGMRDRINALVKKREGFRPFTPAVLESKAHLHFDLDHASPFMTETCQVTSPLTLAAVTHVDNSARVQTVSEKNNLRFARLLKLFEEKTGCPILLNTSFNGIFNLRDEPIVRTPVDAVWCFARSDINALVMEDWVVERSGLGWWEKFQDCVSAKMKASYELSVSERVYTFT